MHGSANASVVLARATEKPSSRSHSAMISAHCSGSWPAHPPHTISALRIAIPSCSWLDDNDAADRNPGQRRPHTPGLTLTACGCHRPSEAAPAVAAAGTDIAGSQLRLICATWRRMAFHRPTWRSSSPGCGGRAIAAIPLEPAARIVGMNPALGAPYRERLAGIDTEIVERGIAFAGR